MPTQVQTVHNLTGLHARPARRFAETAALFTSTIRVRKGSKAVNGKSVLGLLTLGARHLDTVTIEAEGPDAAEAVASLGRLLQQQHAE
ncbi:HPr family phosphocarrier protein [Opitutus sp. ER46]|uniref:HPr family phosphocarrier protein n=1 Tax=Opitutus sp. ER46 TaxID=2161864 RepID=UPI000D31A407|nr:HPr family phosphocarrier protein [Opitutus sp. ER46]PTX90980.1 HPr family phosphocarrier protein [Opitutus sp. ER46]